MLYELTDAVTVDGREILPVGTRLRMEQVQDVPPPEDPETPPPPVVVEAEPPGSFPAVEGSHGVPNFAAWPSLVSMQDGDAADPATWGGRVPGQDDRVLNRHRLTITSDLRMLRFGNAGTLVPIRGKVWCKDAINLPGGTVDLNRTEKGFTWWIRSLPLDREKDPSEWGTCFITLGRLIGGRSGIVKPPVAFAVDTIPAGATRIPVEAVPARWEVGDAIGLPRTSQTRLTEYERNRIVALEGDEFVLESPTKYEHPAVRRADGSFAFGVPIWNLNRDITFRSEDPDAVRGHFVATGHGYVNAIDVACVDMGRTRSRGFGELAEGAESQVGRYAGHWHHYHGQSAYIAGWLFDVGDEDRGLRWAYSIHQTHGCVFTDNGLWGAADNGLLATEDGPEYQNLVARNAMGCTGQTGVWFHGPMNYFEGNLVAGCNATAYHIGYHPQGDGAREVPYWVEFPIDPADPHGARKKMPLQDTAPLRWKGNIAVGCYVGYRFWEVGRSVEELEDGTIADRPKAMRILVEGMRLYHCRDAYLIYYEFDTVVRGGEIIGQRRWSGKEPVDGYPRGYSRKSIGLHVATKNTVRLRVENVRIENCYYGIHNNHRGAHRESWYVNCRLDNVGHDFHHALWQQGGRGVTHLVDPVFGGNASAGDINMDLGPQLEFSEDVLLLTRDGVTHRLYGDYQRPDFSIPAKDDDVRQGGMTNAEAVAAGLPPLGGAIVPTDRAFREERIDAWLVPEPAEA